MVAIGPLSAREAPGALAPDGDPVDLNPLAGYHIQLSTPPLVLRVEGERVAVDAREATLLLDGRPAALLEIPGGEGMLPRRRWTWRDYLVAAGVGVGAGALGYVAGWVAELVAGALR